VEMCRCSAAYCGVDSSVMKEIFWFLVEFVPQVKWREIWSDAPAITEAQNTSSAWKQLRLTADRTLEHISF
jgi:hypothetical protein